MAQFEFKITSDDAGEMAGLMDKLFGKHVHVTATTTKPINTPTEAPDVYVEPEAEVVRRKRRTKAELEAADQPAAEAPAPAPAAAQEEAETADEPEPEVTLDMVKALGSKALGVIKASGVAAIFKSHGKGAESFGSLPPETYSAVYTALNEAMA
jgi:hypothetical protein